MRKQADERQTDMFALLEPVRDLHAEHMAKLRAASPANMVGRDKFERPLIKTRAWSHDGVLTLYGGDDPEPFEVVVRGVPCVIQWSGGVGTHAIGEPGSPFWSDTGFRSFMWLTTDRIEIVRMIEAFIDAPAKDGNGCGGKLKPWWPSPILDLRDRRRDMLRYPNGEGAGAEYWANMQRWEREGEEKVRALGFDPDVVAPWPAAARQRELV
jgi:hypothetical protein